MDYETYLRRVAELGDDVVLCIEHYRDVGVSGTVASPVYKVTGDRGRGCAPGMFPGALPASGTVARSRVGGPVSDTAAAGAMGMSKPTQAARQTTPTE